MILVICPLLTALGPRRPRASRASLTNGKRRGDLQPPLLVAPILPPLPELNAFAPEQPWSSIAGMAGMAPGPGLGYPGPGELPVLLRFRGQVLRGFTAALAVRKLWFGYGCRTPGRFLSLRCSRSFLRT